LLIDFLRSDSLSSDQAQETRLFVGAAIIAHSVYMDNQDMFQNGGKPPAVSEAYGGLQVCERDCKRYFPVHAIAIRPKIFVLENFLSRV